MGTMIGIILALILTAMVLLFLEICTPSFGLLAAVSIGCMGVAVWLAFRLATWARVGMVVALLIGIPIYLVGLVKLLPNTPLGRKMFLRKARKAAGEATPMAHEYEEFVGKTATTLTPLRPVAAIRVGGHRIDAQAEIGMIEEGCTVRIIKSTGTGVVVRLEDPEN